MKYRKETVKSPLGTGVRYYPVVRRVVDLREVAQRIESSRGVSSIDTMRVIWNFFDEIIPMLMDGDRIEITNYCSLGVTIKKDNDGSPRIGGIQLTPSGTLRKAIAKACLNADKTVR